MFFILVFFFFGGGLIWPYIFPLAGQEVFVNPI